MDSDIGEFDFKPLNEGLGFHRKVKPLETEVENEEPFSFSALGSGTLDITSREQSKGLLSSVPSFGLSGSNSGTIPGAAASPASAASGRSKHNTKSVSDLIAALPPSLDLLLDESAASSSPGGTNAKNSLAVSSGITPSARKRAPLFGPPSDELVKPGAPAAASLAKPAQPTAEKIKKGFLNLPLGRSDYGLKTKPDAASAPASAIDENVAKTFPTVFPHLGSLAGQPAAAALKAPMASANTTMSKSIRTNTELTDNSQETAIAAHFGSAVLDTLVTIGIASLFLAVALSITGANLVALLESSHTDSATMSSLAIFFFAIGLLYSLASRTWVGATLGEWSYEIRVGSGASRRRWFYPLQVLWRGVVVAGTGFVLMPLISMIAGRDVLKYLTGLQLVSIEGEADALKPAQAAHAAENPA